MAWWRQLTTVRFGLLLLYFPTIGLVEKLLWKTMIYQIAGPSGRTFILLEQLILHLFALAWFVWLWWPLIAGNRKTLASVALTVGLTAIVYLHTADQTSYVGPTVFFAALVVVWFCTEDHGQPAAGVPCPHCGYDMQGQSDCRCPECGERFTIGDLRLR